MLRTKYHIARFLLITVLFTFTVEEIVQLDKIFGLDSIELSDKADDKEKEEKKEDKKEKDKVFDYLLNHFQFKDIQNDLKFNYKLLRSVLFIEIVSPPPKV